MADAVSSAPSDAAEEPAAAKNGGGNGDAEAGGDEAATASSAADPPSVGANSTNVDNDVAVASAKTRPEEDEKAEAAESDVEEVEEDDAGEETQGGEAVDAKAAAAEPTELAADVADEDKEEAEAGHAENAEAEAVAAPNGAEAPPADAPTNGDEQPGVSEDAAAEADESADEADDEHLAEALGGAAAAAAAEETAKDVVEKVAETAKADTQQEKEQEPAVAKAAEAESPNVNQTATPATTAAPAGDKPAGDVVEARHADENDDDESSQIRSGVKIRCMWPNGMWYRLSPNLAQKTDKNVKFEEIVKVQEREGGWVRTKDGWLQLFHPKTDELLYELVNVEDVSEATRTPRPVTGPAAAKGSTGSEPKKVPASKGSSKVVGTSAGSAGEPTVKKRTKAALKKGASAERLLTDTSQEEHGMAEPPSKKKKLDKNKSAAAVGAGAAVEKSAAASSAGVKEAIVKEGAAVSASTEKAPKKEPTAAAEKELEKSRDATRDTGGVDKQETEKAPSSKRRLANQSEPPAKVWKKEDCDAQGRPPMPRPRELRKRIATSIQQERIGDIIETLQDMSIAGEADLAAMVENLEVTLNRVLERIESMSSQRKTGLDVIEIAAPLPLQRALEARDSKRNAEKKPGATKLGTTAKAPSLATPNATDADAGPRVKRRSATAAKQSASSAPPAAASGGEKENDDEPPPAAGSAVTRENQQRPPLLRRGGRAAAATPTEPPPQRSARSPPPATGSTQAPLRRQRHTAAVAGRRPAGEGRPAPPPPPLLGRGGVEARSRSPLPAVAVRGGRRRSPLRASVSSADTRATSTGAAEPRLNAGIRARRRSVQEPDAIVERMPSGRISMSQSPGRCDSRSPSEMGVEDPALRRGRLDGHRRRRKVW